jgi:hypothetical protein
MMNNKDRDDILLLLSTFKCSRNKDSEQFLKKTALRHDTKSISRTYLAIDKNVEKILGYFTLAFKCLDVNDENVDPDVTELMNLKENIAQAYLLGQLARSDDAPPGFGKLMLDKALETFSEGRRMFGCNMVRLDCKDELIEYYVSCGFMPIGKNPDMNLNQMAIFMSGGVSCS